MGTNETDNYVLDVKNTLLGNIMWFAYMFVALSFVVIGANFLGTLDTPEMRLLGAIVYMFSVVRILGLNHPTLEYKPRDN